MKNLTTWNFAMVDVQISQEMFFILSKFDL